MPLPITALHPLPAGTFLDLVRDGAMSPTFSHMGEDIVIYHLFLHYVKKIYGGFYVDIGAHHPRHYSTTKILTFLGWSGINIDASEESIANFRQERPNDINVCCGVAETEGELTYYKFSGGSANTLSSEVAEKWQKENGWQLLGTSVVPVKTINKILDEHLPEGKMIDYMNIDVEGMDRIVIESLDFDKYRPSVITIEMHDANKVRLEEDRTIAFLMRKNYALVSIALSTYILMDCQFPV